MSIISNTTVLSNFASIGQLDVLRRLYQILHIPTEVYEEISAGLEEGYLFYQDVIPVIHPFSEAGWLHLAVMETDELRRFGELPPACTRVRPRAWRSLNTATGRCLPMMAPRGWKLPVAEFECPALSAVSSWPSNAGSPPWNRQTIG